VIVRRVGRRARETEGDSMKRAIAPALLALVVIAAGCSSGNKTGVAQTSETSRPPATAAPSTSTAPVSSIVGTWARVNSCEGFVQALKQAGLLDLAPEWLIGAGYFKSKDQIDRTHWCRGATEVEHSHFFTEAGGFGSYDETGAQVDDGTYELVDDHTIAFDRTTVHFRASGDTLRFDVVVPAPCKGQCREHTAWAISAFYPGPFKRVN
jgi:hypothetical protein